MSIGDKVKYVLRAQQTRMHRCHWPGCVKQVPPAYWGCRQHWYKLPKGLRDKVWKTYRPGQENDLRVSDAYIEVSKEIQSWIKGAADQQTTLTSSNPE
jgi:hypothetical protein